MFNILDLTLKDLLKDADDDLLVFETGVEAKEYIGKLSPWSSHKFQPRKAAKGDDNWKAREQAKFDCGDYTKVEVLESRGLTLPEHFVHLSRKGNCSLAYTKNDEKGRANVQTVISIRGYLETFFSNSVSEAQIEEIKEEQEAMHYASRMKLASTPEEIEKVYTNFAADAEACANSCMRSEASSYAGIHPARVYGAGDLAIAYITDEDGKTTHRTLVWPDKKLYSRVYGTSALHYILKKLGYVKSKYHGGSNPSMAGAKLLHIPHPSDTSRVIMPYVDEKLQVMRHPTESGFFCFTENELGEVDIHETGGSSILHKVCTCDKCGVRDREHRFSSVTINREGLEALWCVLCVKKNTFTDFMTQKIHNKDVFIPINVTIKHPYNNEEMEVIAEEESIRSDTEKYVFCARNRSHAMARPLAKQVIADVNGTIELWSQAAVKTDGWFSDQSGKIYAKEIQALAVVTGLSSNNKKTWARWSEKEVASHAQFTRDAWGRRVLVASAMNSVLTKAFDTQKSSMLTTFTY